jgi:homoserine O-succinyltransferase
MPLEIEQYSAPISSGRNSNGSRHDVSSRPISVALINNMSDAALEATEQQFLNLVRAACGDRPTLLRFASLPQIARSESSLQRMRRIYWPVEELMDSEVDALIVTGAEPITSRLRDEPYWDAMCRLLDWAERSVASSIWSCLAAHAAALHLEGIERQPLPRKLCGVFAHATAGDHFLVNEVPSPLYTPHSRWNDLPLDKLRSADFRLASWSAETGASISTKRYDSLIVLIQSHPEYNGGTLFREYRRDVERFLRGERAQYPTTPDGYFSDDGAAMLSAFRKQASDRPTREMICQFPAEEAIARRAIAWRESAVSIYRNWLGYVAANAGAVTH